MPLEWGETEFNETYSRGYNRGAFESVGWGYIEQHLSELQSRAAFNIQGDEFLIVGCGFGYWLERLLARGAPAANVWGIDPSVYIQANKSNPGFASPAVADKILDLDITAPNILNSLKPYFKGSGRINGFVISTLVLTSLHTDTEIAEFDAACHSILGQGRVAHIFTSDLPGKTGGTPTSAAMNWQPREYWSERLGANSFLLDCQNGFRYWNPQSPGWS